MAHVHLKARRSANSDRLFYQLRQRGTRHWLLAAALIVGGMMLGDYVSRNNLWTDVRYKTYQAFLALPFTRTPLYPKRTVVVLITDEEYWKGELAHRSPIRRDYLARLVEKLDAADAAVIALDFDLRSPIPDGTFVDDPVYRAETDDLIRTVRAAAARRAVILPAGIKLVGDDYAEFPSVYEPSLTDPPRGYLQLPYDLRRVPMPLDIVNPLTSTASRLDSLATAIVKAVDLTTYDRLLKDSADALPFGHYMTEQDFTANRDPADRKVFSATEILAADPVLKTTIAHKVVIVGGSWSEAAYKYGPRIDTHPSPAGSLPGAFVHANYVEAMLNDRTFKPLNEVVVVAAEGILALITAVVLALEVGAWLKGLLVVSSSLLFMAISLFLLQNIGVFLDFFVPLAVIGLHLSADRVLSWRKEARRQLFAANARPQ